MRGEAGRATAAKHTAQIGAAWGEGNLSPGQRDRHPPCGGTSHKVRQHCWRCRLAPWSLRHDSISLFISITSFAGSGQGGSGSQHTYREFSASLAAPRSKEMPWGVPCPGTVGRAASAEPPHCTSPIPAVITLHLGARASGHFLPPLVSPAARNKHPLLF